MTSVVPPDVTEQSDSIAQSVIYIIGTYPLLTTTFIDREIRAIRGRGTSVEVVSLRRPSHELSPDQAGLAEGTTYIRPLQPGAFVRHHARFAFRRPVRYATTLLRLVAGRGQSMRDRARTIGHFGLGVHVAGRILAGGTPDRLHAHFIDRAAVVSLVAARLLDVPYSVTAHASDIYVSPVLLNAKIEGADFVVTCSGYNESHLVREFGAAAGKVTRIYHGLDLDRYVPGEESDSPPPTILAVG
jgi:glycosyltransferase involved in cell wall biosynthesis